MDTETNSTKVMHELPQQNHKDQTKKSYTKPTLKNYGKVSELTQGVSTFTCEMCVHKP